MVAAAAFILNGVADLLTVLLVEKGHNREAHFHQIQDTGMSKIFEIFNEANEI